VAILQKEIFLPTIWQQAIAMSYIPIGREKVFCIEPGFIRLLAHCELLAMGGCRAKID